ncbi:MAG TPA: sulfatase-like hydrolase/transferase, partial [Planctomycetota bacterium]|nr:sulfatase-like hydrolase/transferase [Planctomycetota bacterium]
TARLRGASAAFAALVFVAACGFGGAEAAAPLFTGPQARTLPGASAYPASLGVAVGLAAVAVARRARAHPRSTACALFAAALAAFAADARWFRSGYERFHDLAFVGAFVAAAWAGVVVAPRRARRGAGAAAAALATALLGAGTAAAAWIAGRPDVAAELDRSTLGAGRLAAFAYPWTAPPREPAAEGDLVDAFAPWERAAEEHAAAVDPLAREHPPSILFVTVDALRGDRAPGGPRGAELMPRLARFAADGATFTRAYAAATTSWPSARSILTGLYPDTFLLGPKETPTFLAHLKRAGYRTAYWGGLPVLDARGRRWLPSLATELDDWSCDVPDARALFDKVRTFAAAPGPWFAWIHLGELHQPYRPPPGLATGPGPIGAYEGCIRHVDALLAPFVEEMVGRATVIVSADHGEDFPFEHGFEGHGASVYEGAVRVPLFVRGAGVRKGTFDVPVSLTDLAPTVRGLAGDDEPPYAGGMSLLPAIRGGSTEGLRARRAVFAEQRLDNGGDLLPKPKRAMIAGDAKLVLTENPPRLEAYDLVDDSGETRNLFLSAPERAARLRTAFATEMRGRMLRFNARHGGAEAAFLGDGADGDARLAELIASPDSATRRRAVRLASMAPRPALASAFRALLGDADPEVRAWAAVACGRSDDRTPEWPAETALLGPSPDARAAAFQLLAARPCPAAHDALASLAERDEALVEWRPTALLVAAGDRRGLEQLRRAALHPEAVEIGFEMTLRLVRLRPRPSTPATLEIVARRFGPDTAAGRYLREVAAEIPSATTLRLCEDYAASAPESLRPVAERGLRTVRERIAEAVAALERGAEEAAWWRGPHHAAWGLAAGVDFSRPREGVLDPSQWAEPDVAFPARALSGAGAQATLEAPPGATHLELAWAALAAGALEIELAGAATSAPFGPGPHRRRLPLPPGTAGKPIVVGFRVHGAAPSHVGFRELVFLPATPP